MNDLKGIIEDCNKSDLVSDKVIKKIIEIIGQEEWQDLHDENSDICTTMGELIITLDRIADLENENKVLAQNLEDTEIINKALEKENAELKTKKIPQLERRIASIRGSHSVDAKKLNARIEQVERLKKENAELTKAKEIIKELLNSCFGYSSKTVNYEVKANAEQFLKDNA